jgi:hypothetical protein
VLTAGAVAAAVGGGIALSRAGKLNLRRHKRFLGVPLPKRTAFGKAAKQVNDAVDAAGSAGKQIGQWSDGLQELRQKMADGSLASVSNLADGKSPIEKLTHDIPVIGGDTNGKSRVSKVLDKVLPG